MSPTPTSRSSISLSQRVEDILREMEAMSFLSPDEEEESGRLVERRLFMDQEGGYYQGQW